MKVFSRAFAAIFTTIPCFSLILLLSAFTPVADTIAADENQDITTLYHKFTTEEFPTLHEAIQSVLFKTALKHSIESPSNTKIDVYKDWHERASSIRNIKRRMQLCDLLPLKLVY